MREIVGFGNEHRTRTGEEEEEEEEEAAAMRGEAERVRATRK